MDDKSGRSKPLSPLFRVWLCGAFQVERQVGDAYEMVCTAEWGGSSYPRLLLKGLLCCPGRQARREALIEMLWPEADPEQASHYLNTATTKLRKVLQSAKEKKSLLITEDDSKVYQLEGQHLLWIEMDAAFALLKEAERLGRTSLQALSLLEEADRYFSRGIFLQDEEGQWAASRRATVEQARYRVRIWLAEAYEQQDMPGQAESVLGLLLEEDPIDEDVLGRLMNLLHEQGMTHHALRLYEHACEVFAKEGMGLTEATKEMALQFSLYGKGVRRAKSLPSPTSDQNHDDAFLSRLPLHSIMEAVQELGETPQVLKLAYIKKDDMDTKRRELLHLLSKAGLALALPLADLDWVRIERALIRPSQLDEIVLQHLETINRSLWNVYLTTPIKPSVFEGALGHFKTLIQFLRDSYPTTSHQRLCVLTSEIGQLVGEILFDLNDYEAAESCYTVAALAAKEAQSYDLWSCALVRSAFLPMYRGRYDEALIPLQGALTLSQRGDPSLPTQHWVAAVEAEARSGIFDLVACQRALERAQGVQERREGTPLPWVRFNHARLPALRGACYVRLQQPDRAMPTLQEALTLFVQPDRKRGMVLIDLAAAVVQRGEVEQAHTYIDEIMEILALGSSGFLREALRTLPQRLEPIAPTTSIKALKQYIGQQLQQIL